MARKMIENTSEELEVRIWERQPEETDRAWSAFEIFRGMPSQGRALTRSYVLYRRMRDPDYGRGKKPLRTVPGSFRGWYNTHDWRARATAWDRHKDEAFLLADECDHVDKLRDFRSRLQKYSELSTRNGIKCMRVVKRSLESLESDGGVVPPSLLPKYIQATARLFESASAQEAQALAVDAILEAVGDAPAEIH